MDFLRSGRLHEGAGTEGLHVILDCGHGATYDIAPRFFQSLGIRTEALHTSPNGKNINAGCGSQHPEILSRAVVKNGADVGLAFDGDGDRLIAVDEKGRVLSGDVLIAICARHLKKIGRLPHDTAVSTVMSNLGLGLSLREAGIRHLTTAVGDRYVMQKMLETGAAIGGEDSGHMIFSDHHTTGDGIFTGLRLLEIMAAEGQKLSHLTEIIKLLPQSLINVTVHAKPALDSIPDIRSVIEGVETELGDRGRLLVRYSGTQSCCRVMVEGPTREITQRLCQRVADVVQTHLGPNGADD
jgi:phosphoglucosamine mutase